MNRIRKAGKQERFESGNHESRKSKQFRRFLVSWLPDFLLIFSCVPAFLINSSSAADVVIGSKKFTESYVLGEIAKRTLTDAGIPAEHRQGMGGTIILWEALRGGQIDAYPEYTGTIATEILKSDSSVSLDQIRDSLEKLGVGMTAPLGFNNTYALVMRRSEAQRLGIRTISDLQRYPELKFGLTHEFLERQDGWRPLRQRYGLPQQNIIGIDHALGYSALANGSIAVKDAYSTDAKIEQNDLVVLEDDLHFFPKYEAVFLFRSSTRADAIAALRRLEGTLDETRMIRLNAEAERTKNYARAADLYFERSATLDPTDLRRFFSAQAGALDTSPSPVGWIFAAAFNHRRDSAWHCRESRRCCWPCYSWFRRRCANHPVARVARLACSPALFWNQHSHRHRRAFSVRFAADRAQHRDRFAGHSTIIARIRGRAGTQPNRAPLGSLSADGVAIHPLRNQNQRRD